jgi:glutamyl-tRNA reductase
VTVKTSTSAVLSRCADEALPPGTGGVPKTALCEAPAPAVGQAATATLCEAPTTTVLALIAHARGVPSAAREVFAAECEALAAHDAIILVHTCHRVELYVALGAFGEGKLPQLPEGGLRLEDAAAARHLINVACGLHSAVLGEDQILHQVRETYALRHEARPLDPVLDRLFQVALNAGRRAHGWFAGAPRSLGDVALDEIERVVGSLVDQPILIVGAGSMSRLSAQAATRRGARLTITNRTPERAQALARTIGGKTVESASDGTLGPFAGVIVAVSGSWAVHPQDAARLVESGTTVVDLSSPPAVSAALQAQLGERFVSIDDLAWGPQVELAGGLRGRLEKLVTESGGEYCRWLRARDYLPAIQAMTESAEARRLAELAWLKRRLPNLSEEERALIDQMSHRLVGGILHKPKSALRLDESGDLGRAAWELFGL